MSRCAAGVVTGIAVVMTASVALAQPVPQRVGLTVATLGNPFFVPLIAGVRQALEDANPDVELTVVGADYELNKQSSQLDSFVGSGVDLIMINSVDAVAVGPAVRRATGAGIIVGAMGGIADGADVTVMTNNYQAGQVACQYLADQLDGAGQVIIIDGPPISSINDRVNGCKSVFENYPDLEILSDNQDGKASREGGFAVMQGLLTRFPHIDAVFGANDPTAIGADLAARQLHRSEMIFAGVDGSPDGIAAIRDEDSRVVATASQDPYQMGLQSTQYALQLYAGQTIDEPVVLLDSQLVTRDNVDDYIGWDAER